VKLPAHESTTAQLGAVYPFAASRTLPIGGVVIGRDRFGGVFAHDPFELYAAGVLTNPNMVVLGQIGRGKSTFVKSYLFRQAAFGRRIVVLDPKGEYGPLAAALGVTPIALRPDGDYRINPLDVSVTGRAGETPSRRRLELAAAIGVAAMRRELRPVEHAALERALTRIEAVRTAPPTFADLFAGMLEPTDEDARSIGMTRLALADGSRDLALELRRLVLGELRGMFDGPTSAGLDLDGNVVILDLAALYHSPALGVLTTCAAAAIERSVRQSQAQRTVLVVDEAWAVLTNIGVARFLQSSWKFARAWGVANIAVVHRVSDLAAVGPSGSETGRLAEGLLADSETVVCYGQPASELPLAAPLLGLSPEETRLVGHLGRGSALWKVAGRSFLVDHCITDDEKRLVYTDQNMAGRG